MGTVYNELSLKISEATSTIQYDNSLLTTNATFDYRAESAPGSGLWTGDFQGGVVTHVRTTTNLSATAQHTTNSYVWWDDARLSVVVNKPSASLTYTSTYAYDENGKLASVNIQDGRPREVNFVTDIYGQVMSRTEYTPNTPTQNNPKSIYYYFNGLRVGDIGNNGPSQVDYATAIGDRGAPPQSGPFKYGMPSYHGDFDQAFDPISPGSEPQTAGNYVVREGDTLQSIARAVWGDAAMWYLIADANGLNGSSALVAGQSDQDPAQGHQHPQQFGDVPRLRSQQGARRHQPDPGRAAQGGDARRRLRHPRPDHPDRDRGRDHAHHQGAGHQLDRLSARDRGRSRRRRRPPSRRSRARP